MAFILTWIDCISSNIINGLLGKSSVSCHIQMASCVAFISAIYSVSTVDRVIQICFFEHQLTVAPLVLNMYPNVDLWSSRFPAQSASEYPTHSLDFSLVYNKLKFNLTFLCRYLIICFTHTCPVLFAWFGTELCS